MTLLIEMRKMWLEFGRGKVRNIDIRKLFPFWTHPLKMFMETGHVHFTTRYMDAEFGGDAGLERLIHS